MKITNFIHNVTSHSLAKNSAVVFAGSMTANVLAYIYHLCMGRLLGPSGYGELSSLLSLLYIFTVPLLVAQTVLVKFVSGFKAHGEVGQAKSLFLAATKVFAVVSMIGLPVILISGPYITSFLHLSSATLVTFLYVLLVVSLLTIPTASMLTGYQKFIWVSMMGVLAMLVKLLVSIPLVAWGVSGVMIAAVIASFIVYGVYFIPLRSLLSVRARPTQLSRRDTLGFAIPTLLTLLGITSLYSTDIILVRHFFDAQSSGLYAALAVLGKIIFYASSAVTFVLFPIVAERTAKKEDVKKLIWAAVGGVTLMSVGLTLFYFLFPEIIIRLLFGNAYTDASTLLGIFGAFLALFSVGNIIVTACLALGRTRIWIIPVFCALIQVIGISMFHASIHGVILLNIAVCSVLVVGSLGYYVKTS